MGNTAKKLGIAIRDSFLEKFNDGEICIDTSFSSGILDEFLKTNYFQEGEVLKIAQGTITTNGEQEVTIEGLSDFMNIPRLPIKSTIVFWDNGSMSVKTEYTLIQSGQATDYWQFKKSFPMMPRHPSSDSPFQGKGSYPYADEFQYREAKVVVSSHETFDEDYQRDLVVGINFLARVNLYSSLGVIQHLLDQSRETIVHGVIIRPSLQTNLFAESMPAKKTSAHNERAFPWDYAATLPGVHLEASIGHDIELKGFRLGETKLKIYCPLDDWNAYDSIYKPQKAITGTLELPDADIKVEGIASQVGDDALTVYTRFEGLSIKNLSSLVSPHSGTNLNEHLPSPIQSAIKELGELEILDLGFTLRAYTNSDNKKAGLSLTYTTVKVGFRNLNWNIWDDHIVVDNLSFRFELIGGIRSSIKASFTSGTIFSDIPITITGTKWGSQYLLDVSLDDQVRLPFRDFLKKFAPDLPAPCDLTINQLSIEICVGSYISISGSLANEPDPWSVDLGPTSVEVENISFELNRLTARTPSSSQRMQGFITGTIAVDGFTMQVNYQLPNNLSMNAYIPRIQLSHLQKQLSGGKGSSPIDFELINTRLIAKAEQTGFLFKAMSTVSGLGMLAFQVGKTNDGWGAASGIYLPDPRLSKIKGLEFLSPIDKMIHLKDLTLVLSSMDHAQFQFPTGSEFGGQHALNSSGLQLPQVSSGVMQGLNAYGLWVLNPKDKIHKLLKDTFKLDDGLPVTIQISSPKGRPPSIHLFSSVTGEFEKAPFGLQVGIRMQSGAKLEYYVTGRGEISVSKQKMLMDLGVSVTLSGFAMSGSLQGTIDLHGLKISDLAVMGSINWAGIPGFGFAGRINTKAFQSSVVMLLDSANMGMVLAGSISELTAYKVVTSIAGVEDIGKDFAHILKNIEIRGTKEFTMPKAISLSLDNKDLKAISSAFSESGGLTLPNGELEILLVCNKKGKKWFLTNRRDSLKTFQIDLLGNKLRVVEAPQIYICTSYSRIGSNEFQPGFLLSACVRIMSFEAYASIDISPNKGIAIDAYINKAIVIGSKEFFLLSDIKGKTGPYLSVSTYTQPKHPVKEYRPPHLFLNGRLKVMGLQVDCYAEISSKALKIDANLKLTNTIKSSVAKGKVEFDILVQANVGDIEEFFAKFAIAYKVSIDLYLSGVKALEFDTAIAGAIELGLKNGKPYAHLAAALKMCGDSYKVGVTLQPGKDNLNDAGKFLAREVSHFFESIYEDVERFVEDVGKGVLKGFEETEKLGKVLVDHFDQSAKDVAHAFDSLGHDVEDIAKALDKQLNQSAKEIGAVLTDIGKPAKDIANGLEAVGHGFEAVGKTLADVGHAPEDIAQALSHIDVDPNQIAKTLSKINIKPLDISNAISGLDISSNDVDKALKTVSIDTHAIEKSVSNAVDDVTEFFDDVGKAVTGIFSSKKKKKKKKHKRKPSADEICKNLSKVTDNYSFMYQKIQKAGHSSESALGAIAKTKGPTRTLLAFMEKKLGNDDNVFRLLTKNGWTDVKVAREMNKARYDIVRITIMLKMNGYGPTRTREVFSKARISVKAYQETVKECNARVVSNLALYTAHKRFVRAEDGGGKGLKGDAKQAKSHERLIMLLLNPAPKAPKDIRHGSKVALMTQKHYYLRADKNGNLDATPTKAGRWETFTLTNHTAQDRPIKKGDVISFKSAHKKFVVAEKKSLMKADRDKIGAWEKFTAL
ncbi:fascin domain-containing protein [Pseudobacteriovorax antillogorgiicola]|uniref:Methyl-accepting chemotaxis protein n=1 Tax=Pseudobacteriovorax antillogorgiicola TaxID=1513793 RepID=A0A1Y6B7L3_9BACT|nr:hypothetical protein [Pseudobacteriovorax antillogorgiicola]TCS58782.1 methyl-accepting chemotaxis protein [Pseudobacteriovorax antillogorgiicola]SME94769.1 Methyl-accepting chemotaxis protein [Pseudobacteriovorax antillogorgiicola]